MGGSVGNIYEGDIREGVRLEVGVGRMMGEINGRGV